MTLDYTVLNFTGPKADYSLLGDIQRKGHYILTGPGTDLDETDTPKRIKRRYTRAQQRARHGLRLVGGR